MVRKFLTRESTYSQLLMTVSENESRINHLKKENEELSKRLHELRIDSNGTDSAKNADTDII